MDDSSDIPGTGEVIAFPSQAPSKPPKKPRPGGHKRRRYYEALARGDMAEAERLKPGRVTAEIRKEVMALGMPDPLKVQGYEPKAIGPRQPFVTFNQSVAKKICDRLLNGEPLARICDDTAMPDYSTVWQWERDNADFRAAMAVARRDGSNHIADDCIKIADDLTIDPAHKRVMVETRLRLIKSWAPRIYGDQIKVTDSEGGSIKFVIEGLTPPPDKANNALDITPRKD